MPPTLVSFLFSLLAGAFFAAFLAGAFAAAFLAGAFFAAFLAGAFFFAAFFANGITSFQGVFDITQRAMAENRIGGRSLSCVSRNLWTTDPRHAEWCVCLLWHDYKQRPGDSEPCSSEHR